MRGLVERWKAAQNRGDFAGYQGLYAARMTGIKRVGARVFTFDRAGWMADRGRMFKKKMEVAADQVEVSPSGSSALVRLQQTFEQGKFQDVGRKELVVVREAGGLRIAREEMLSSTVVGRTAGAGGPLADFYFMLDDEVLLEADSGASETGTPALDPDSGSASFRARAGVDTSSLEAPIAALVGKKLTVYGEDGALCDAPLGRLSLVAGLTPHFGTAAEWRGEGDTPALSEAETASEIWQGGRTVLVGRAGACKGLFARAGAPVVAFEPVDDPVRAARVHAAFRKLPEWQATQKSFGESGGKGRWDQGDTPATISIVRHPTSGKTWAVVHATGGEPCSQFGAEMTAVFEQVGAGWKNRSAATLEPFQPAAAFDLDGDGAPEFVAPRLLVGDTGDGYGTLLEFAYPDHDCPC